LFAVLIEISCYIGNMFRYMAPIVRSQMCSESAFFWLYKINHSSFSQLVYLKKN